jgi:hypothetical protein
MLETALPSVFEKETGISQDNCAKPPVYYD